MDKDTRNAIERATQRARKLLEDDFASQLDGTFDVLRDGTVAPKPGPHLAPRQMFQRGKIVAAIERKRAAGRSAAEAVVDYLRDAAFTTLNRFVALKMLEARELMQECITKGEQSGGYREFCGMAPDVARLPDSAGYRLYIECLFDELSTEVRILFNRRDAASALWPRRATFTALLETLNVPGLAGVWGEDETLGWVYQYYNSGDERKKMREESAAPRNSHELAVRNQFFTPRYVVEFLTDNTLGRIWYEMTRGETKLKEQCRYLIRRANEIFLSQGEPAQQAHQDNLSQEDLYKRLVFIPHRPLKDPRTILMLDPACGSMHFGLYAFDLFEVIYDEAWELEAMLGACAPSRSPGMKSLHDTYGSKDVYMKEVPRLIIEHNLHGIDIDPRCAQIAGLSLWLRAQKDWQRLGLNPDVRPVIKRSNIVCAEAMPGEKKLLREFIEREFSIEERKVFLQLLEAIFDQMKLAGEAGSLLKIEEEIRSAVAEAKAQWRKGPQPRQVKLFTELEPPEQGDLPVDFSGITDEQFWITAEKRIYDALRHYAEQAENGGGFQRRLFADDAVRGFAFIDLCRKRYDVALMNPPFGEASLPSKPYLDDTYGDTRGDVYKAFVECFQARLVPAGYLGIISSRAGFFLGQSEDWRTRVVLRLFRPIAIADLGSGVLDAMVEVAAYVLRSLSAQEARDLTHSLVPVLETVALDRQERFSLPKWQATRDGLKRHQAASELKHLESAGFIQRCPGDIVRYTPLWRVVKEVTAPPEPVFPPLVCIRALADEDKGAVLRGEIAFSSSKRTFVTDPGGFASVPGRTFSYWVGPSVRRVFSRFAPFKDGGGRNACMTNPAGDDTRYFRASWEVPAQCVGRTIRWVPLAKGGAFSPYYADVHLLVDWDPPRETYRGFLGTFHRPMSKPASLDCFFRPGLTWPRRTTSGLAFRALPAGCIFSDKGPIAIVPDDDSESLLTLLAIGNSKAFEGLVGLQLAAADTAARSYEVGVIQRTPLPPMDGSFAKKAANLARGAWIAKRSLDCAESTSHAFVLPAVLSFSGTTLAERAAACAARVRALEETVAAIQAEIDDLAFCLYGLNAADRAALTAIGIDSTADAAVDASEDEEVEAATADATALAADLMAYALGAAFGRWDVRLATGQNPATPEPDPFDPLPVCPPGMLLTAADVPATPADVPADYPLRISWDGILVDDPHHPADVGQRLREFFELLWPDRADDIEQEACALLGVKSLGEYFRKPAGFFADHLKHYSKSRRQAPIYWPLSSPNGLYTVWLYYHRLTADTLFTVLRDHVKPKLEFEERRANQLKQEAGPTPSQTHRREIAEAEGLVEDLRAFLDELNGVAALFRPNLNDGVIINHAPLWRMIGLPKWRKDVEAVWEELVNSKYDWAYIAMHLWPERVVPKCVTDRSLAIAHGLDNEFWVEGSDGKWKPRTTPLKSVEEIVRDRSSPAVKAALNRLLDAPTASGNGRARGRRAASSAATEGGSR